MPRADRQPVLIAILLCSAAIVAPVWLGATSLRARFLLEMTVGLAGLLCLGANGYPRIAGWIGISLIGVAAMACVPIPAAIHLILAPATRASWLAAGAHSVEDWLPISVDPGLTATAARRLFLCYTVMATAATVSMNGGLKRAFVVALGCTAGLALALGFAVPVQRDQARLLLGTVDLTGPIDWWMNPIIDPRESAGFGRSASVVAGLQRFSMIDWAIGDGFGSYIVSNHFAGLIYLAVPSLAAVVLIWGSALMSRTAAIAVAAGTFVVAFGTVAWLAGSRAGAVAVLLAALGFAGAAADSNRVRWWFNAMALTVATSAIVYCLALHGYIDWMVRAFPKSLIATMADSSAGGRVAAVDVAEELFRESPWIGWGLGTYGALYPAKPPLQHVHSHAHNEYAELLAESGLLGAACGVGFLSFLVGRFRRFHAQAAGSQRIVGAAAWAGLMGLMVHSAFDWNLRVPANAFVACLVTGVALSSSVRPKPVGESSSWAGFSPPSGVEQVIFSVVMLGVLGFMARDTASDFAERDLRQAIVNVRQTEQKSVTAGGAVLLNHAALRAQVVAGYDKGNAQLAALIGDAELLSAVYGDSQEAGRHLAEAEKWFEQARRNAAAPLGLPQPVVPPRQ